MNVTCPQCKTVFRVDPRKVPDEGVRARCSVCGGVFEVVAEGADRPEAAAVAAAPSAEPAAPAAAQFSVPSPPAQPSAEAQSFAIPEPELDDLLASLPEAAAPEAEAPQPAAPKIEAKPEPPTPPAAPRAGRAPAARFGQPDPDARARRLARALISDVAAYHPERQEIGLREGRLKELFRDELKKSWQEYVEQVGLDLAKSTPYFRDALNEILAKGKRVF